MGQGWRCIWFFRDVCVSQNRLRLFEQCDHSVQASWQPECLALTGIHLDLCEISKDNA